MSVTDARQQGWGVCEGQKEQSYALTPFFFLCVHVCVWVCCAEFHASSPAISACVVLSCFSRRFFLSFFFSRDNISFCVQNALSSITNQTKQHFFECCYFLCDKMCTVRHLFLYVCDGGASHVMATGSHTTSHLSEHVEASRRVRRCSFTFCPVMDFLRVCGLNSLFKHLGFLSLFSCLLFVLIILL
jgi:hypothetical protein